VQIGNHPRVQAETGYEHRRKLPIPFGDNLALDTAIFRVVMPPLIDVIHRRSWSSEVKGVFAFAWCFLASLLLVWPMEQLTGLRQYRPEQWLRAFMIVFVTAITLHRWFWKPTGIGDTISRATG
jgi:hypothetical protein